MSLPQIFNIAARSPFDSIKQVRPDLSEYWSARDLMPMLGYSKWERFADAVERAKTSCKNAGMSAFEHFPGAGKPIISGKGREQDAQDFHLTRYAAYLVAMNGDPRKPEIAAAQGYFAVKTHEAEQASQEMPLPSNFREALLMLVTEIDHNEALSARNQSLALEMVKKDEVIESLQEDAEFVKAVANADSCVKIREFAASAHITGIWDWLLAEKIFYEATNGWSREVKKQPYKEYVDRGYFRMVQSTFTASDGTNRVSYTPYVTGKGEIFLLKRWRTSQMRRKGVK